MIVFTLVQLTIYFFYLTFYKGTGIDCDLTSHICQVPAKSQEMAFLQCLWNQSTVSQKIFLSNYFNATSLQYNVTLILNQILQLSQLVSENNCKHFFDVVELGRLLDTNAKYF